MLATVALGASHSPLGEGTFVASTGFPNARGMADVQTLVQV